MTVQDKPIVTPQAHVDAAPHARSDAQIADQVREHHAAMVTELDRLTARLRDAAPAEQETAHRNLEEWFETVLVPHAEEEEATTYHAAGELPEGRLLIEAMVREHILIKRLVGLFSASEAAAAAAYGRAVFEAFTNHQGKENDVILPLLVEAPHVSLVEVMGGAHGHQVGEHAPGRAHHH
ncbi:MAG TPA: hemerythrin domain-containing protein [Nocardioidaceae bacterium]|nr:hemerythrin domain-containing protein [Nocardioidaceae bacterium]